MEIFIIRDLDPVVVDIDLIHHSTLLTIPSTIDIVSFMVAP